jgi:hypothetical protein
MEEEAMSKVGNVVTLTLATLTAMTVASASAATITLDLGQATGGIGMYYNHPPEDPMGGANLAYMRAQIGQGNVNGAAFAFDTTDLGYIDPLLAGLTMANIFGDQGQFGFDLVVPGNPTIPVPTLMAVDNGGVPEGNVGPVVWAVNDYKPGGPVNPAATRDNSLFRSIDADPGNSLTLDTFDVTGLGGGIWTVNIAGTLISDNYIHWFNPGTSDADLSDFLGLNPVIGFSGTLTYNRALDVTPGMDFYAGNIDFTLTANIPDTDVPDAGSTAAMLSLAGFGLALFRRRFVR